MHFGHRSMTESASRDGQRRGFTRQRRSRRSPSAAGMAVAIQLSLLNSRSALISKIETISARDPGFVFRRRRLTGQVFNLLSPTTHHYEPLDRPCACFFGCTKAMQDVWKRRSPSARGICQVALSADLPKRVRTKARKRSARSWRTARERHAVDERGIRVRAICRELCLYSKRTWTLPWWPALQGLVPILLGPSCPFGAMPSNCAPSLSVNQAELYDPIAFLYAFTVHMVKPGRSRG